MIRLIMHLRSTRPAMLRLLSLLLAAMVSPAAFAQVSFKRDIRPILSDNCFYCHGPDGNHREADLRLDTQEGALTAIEAGKPDESELLRRLVSHDLDERMPPPKSNKQLTAEQINLLRQWIAEGAPWEAHWSFTPLSAPPVPIATASTRAASTRTASTATPLTATPLTAAALTSGTIRNPIDAFVQTQLDARGWHAADEADRRTLIRRVTLDLTGLPPTKPEVDAFLSDSSPTAYERVVDRLLQSSAFGERMAWDWLDAARYADTNGYQGDNERTMWPWRDWVVQAFNKNMPYDQFTVWQLAGDLLPEATLEQKLATGFLRNHMINGEGGRIAEENRVDYVMDMTETVGTVWMGLTLNCCRCHDHKFDPLRQRDYYQLFAFFNQTPVDGGGGNPQTPPVLPVPSREQQSRLDEIDQQISAVDRKLKSRAAELAAQFHDWEQSQRESLRQNPSPWRVSQVAKATATHQKLEVLADQSLLASGETVANDSYEVELHPGESSMASLRLEALQHESLPNGGLSRWPGGNFVLTSFEVYLRAANSTERRRLKISDAKATFEQGELKVKTALDDDPKTGWGVWEGHAVDRSHSAVFYFKEPLWLAETDRLLVVLKHESQHAQHMLGRFRLSTSASETAEFEETDPKFEAALKKTETDRDQLDRALLTARQQRGDQSYLAIQAERRALDDARKAVMAAVPNVMVMAQRPQPRETTMLSRGLYNQPGEKVEPQVPVSLPALCNEFPADRLALAKWLVSSEQPLTARVVVNRFWQQFFGGGLVKTVEDFGSQGEVPRYLDLLDWLSTDFRDSGWNVKHLVRLLVTSHTYRQSSQLGGSALAADDPDNRWLTRGPRFRMPSWMLRDQALAASGLLVNSMGGPSVNSYQPEGIWEEATFGLKKYQRGAGDALYRRSLYTFWRRIIGPTMFFDNASRQVCTVKVVRTNTPLQALFTLNDVTFIEAARALASKSLLDEANSIQARIDLIFQQILARPSSDKEAAVLIAALERSRQQFTAQPDQADALLAVGESTPPAQINRVELASWTALCLAVLNLDEALTKE